MSDALRVMPGTLEIDQRVIRSLDSGGFHFALNAPPKTRRRARFSRRYRDEKKGTRFSWSYGGPNESIKVGQVKLTNAFDSICLFR
jgi:hypothetical protein